MTIDGERWRRDFEDLKRRLDTLEARHEEREDAIIAKAVYQSQKTLLGRFGVDVDNPGSVEEFNKNLQFGKSMQGTMTKAAWAFISAFCGGMGMAVWVILQSVFRHGH